MVEVACLFTNILLVILVADSASRISLGYTYHVWVEVPSMPVRHNVKIHDISV